MSSSVGLKNGDSSSPGKAHAHDKDPELSRSHSGIKKGGSTRSLNNKPLLLKQSFNNEDRDHEPTAPSPPPATTDSSPPKPVFKKKLVGDLFGSNSGSSNMAGYMYRSRIIDMTEKVESKEVKVEEASVADSTHNSIQIDSDSGSDNEFKQLKTMNPKQQLALTIKNWSIIPDNDRHILEEGAVYALIALSQIDDTAIRRYCATSFFHLSSRSDNRQQLLNMGTTAGVITLSMSARTLKVAKMCAYTLCYLSMEKDGEATMAKEGAILALVVLLGYKGHSLLPCCVQSLYNLTCSTEHFKGIDRVIKALLTVSTAGFDHSELLVKALVNCTRYPWMRLRIIEDGALAYLNSLVPSLPSRSNCNELALYILAVLKALSESSGCRMDMLSKGTVDCIRNLLTYCDAEGKLVAAKTLHNFLLAPANMKNSDIETAVIITAQIAHGTADLVTLQYVAACFQIFTQEKVRGLKYLAVLLIDTMPHLLQQPDPVVQFFAISTAGNIFFSNLCNNPVKVELLIKSFVEYGPTIVDPAANQALALALAKLSQEQMYMAMIERLQLLPSMMELLLVLMDMHKASTLLQESCCIAVCRIALRLENLETKDKERIANVFIAMLDSEDKFVLSSTIAAVRALGASGLCPKQLLSPALLDRVADIVRIYAGDLEMCRTGCAVLAVFSYDESAHEPLASERIMNVLFANIRAEDGVTKELVANTLCNLSTNSTACAMMIRMGVVEVLATLSNTTSEVILELCAKCICNLSCYPVLHPQMVAHKVLDIVLMISLVRSVSYFTKLTAAKTLLNIISDDNLNAIKESGAVRIFATLSAIDHPPIQHICSKGFHLLTLTDKRREELVQRRAVLQSLFNMVKCSSSRTRIKVGTSVCNLLACANTNKAAIKAGALAVIKIIATMDFEELRESTARVILTLAQDASLHKILLREPIVPILVLILQQSHGFTFECAVFALGRLAQTDIFRLALIEKGCITALVSCVLSGKIATHVMAEEFCRCVCYLSVISDKSVSMISSGHLILALQAVYLSGVCNADTALLIAITMRNLSTNPAARRLLMEQGAFKLLVGIAKDFNHRRFKGTVLYSCLIEFLYNIAQDDHLHSLLVTEGCMDMFGIICLASDNARRYMHSNNMLLDVIERRNPPAVPPVLLVGNPHGITQVMSDEELQRGQAQQAQAEELSRQLRVNSSYTTTLAETLTEEGNEAEEAKGDDEKSCSSETSTNGDLTDCMLTLTEQDIETMCSTLQLLCSSSNCHQIIVEGGVMLIFQTLAELLPEKARSEVTMSLAHLCGSKKCRAALVRQGACELLIALSAVPSSAATPKPATSTATFNTTATTTLNFKNPPSVMFGTGSTLPLPAPINTSGPAEDYHAITQTQCALALGYLSELTQVRDGTVASRLLLSLNIEDSLALEANKAAQAGGAVASTPMNLNPSQVMAQQQQQQVAAAAAAAAGENPVSSPLAGGGADAGDAVKGKPNKGLDGKPLAVAASGAAGAGGDSASVGSDKDKVMSASSTQALSSMIRDLMGDKPKFDAFLAGLHNTHDGGGSTKKDVIRSTMEGFSHSKLIIAGGNKQIVQGEEAAVLKCDFSRYHYDIRHSEEVYPLEAGGMSSELQVELPLPGIPENRELESDSRHEELQPLSIARGPMPKFTSTPVMFDASSVKHDLGGSAENSVTSPNERMRKAAKQVNMKGGAPNSNLSSLDIKPPGSAGGRGLRSDAPSPNPFGAETPGSRASSRGRTASAGNVNGGAGGRGGGGGMRSRTNSSSGGGAGRGHRSSAPPVSSPKLSSNQVVLSPLSQTSMGQHSGSGKNLPGGAWHKK